MKKLIIKAISGPESRGSLNGRLLTIVRFTRQYPRRLAFRLQKMSQGFSNSQKLAVLGLLFILTVSNNVRLLYNHPPRSMRLNLGQIKSLLPPGPFKNPLHSGGVDPIRYQQLMQFKEMVDSLSRTVQGKAVYNRIQRSRPGLVDSLVQLQELYEALHAHYKSQKSKPQTLKR